MSAYHPEATFIHDTRTTYDICQNPSHLQQHGSYSFDFARRSHLRPLFQWSKQYRNSDILSTPLEAYSNTSTYIPWDQKTDKRIFWRGSPTGDSYRKGKHTDDLGGWRMSHRPRLALMAQETEGKTKVWVQRGNVWRLEEWDRGVLNQEYLDIGLTGNSRQVCPFFFPSLFTHYPLFCRTSEILIFSAIKKMGHATRWNPKSNGQTELLPLRQQSPNVCLCSIPKSYPILSRNHP